MIAHDIHAHYYPAEYSAVVAEVAQEDGAHADVARAFLKHRIIQSVPTFTGEIDQRLRLMDDANIGIQVLSFGSLNIWHPDPEMRARLTRAHNDGCAAIAAEHPDRFRFLATLPFPHVEQAVTEALRVRELPGFVGYTVPTHFDTQVIDHDAWHPIYKAMNQGPTLALVHPDGFCARGALDDYSMEWAIGAPFEDTIAAVRLLCSGLIDRFPQLNWVVPHLGGTLPFLLHRLMWRWELEAELLGTSRREGIRLDRLLFDTANSTPMTLQLALETLPKGSLVFGTDFPFVDPEALSRPASMIRNLSNTGFPVHAVLRDTLEPHLNRKARHDDPLPKGAL